MNIFEDLIDELKESNLLEETVIEINSARNQPQIFETEADEYHQEAVTAQADSSSPLLAKVSENKTISIDERDFLTEIEKPSEKEFEITSLEDVSVIETNQIEFETNQELLKEDSHSSEFYRKRAVDEVAFLQMVEHVFGGVEREQMKVVPKQFDDLEVKKVLHSFIQISQKPAANTLAQAEFQLLQETENWYSTLTHRDKRISINHLRRFCETVRPPLSSQALISLARFYRNSPYSEQVRGKFDFVITRLYSKDIENEHREMIYKREELIKKLKEYYADWSSIPLYPDESDSNIILFALKFEDFITEANVAESFDELIKNDYFNRLRLFKKETNENFFSPLIVAANIEANIKIGNRYVELLEKGKENKLIYEDKYGFLHDQSISDATGKTFQLNELLNRKPEKPKFVEPSRPAKKKETKSETKVVKESKKETAAKIEAKAVKGNVKTEKAITQVEETTTKKSFFGISSWLLTAIIFTMIATIGIYVWANNGETNRKNAKPVNLENSSLKEEILSAQIDGDTFSGKVKPTWNDLAQAKKEDILKKIISVGSEKGFKKVQLQNSQGKIVGTASSDKVQIYNP